MLFLRAWPTVWSDQRGAWTWNLWVTGLMSMTTEPYIYVGHTYMLHTYNWSVKFKVFHLVIILFNSPEAPLAMAMFSACFLVPTSCSLHCFFYQNIYAARFVREEVISKHFITITIHCNIFISRKFAAIGVEPCYKLIPFLWNCFNYSSLLYLHVLDHGFYVCVCVYVCEFVIL